MNTVRIKSAAVLAAVFAVLFFVAALAGPAEKFTFVVIGDSHIIDHTYECCEGGGPDGINTRTLYKARERLEQAVESINAIEPRPELLIHVGDMVHNYHRPIEYYFENHCHLDIAAGILDRLEMPWFLAIGNHDSARQFEADEISELLAAKPGVERVGPKSYQALDHKGFRFVLLNHYRGEPRDGGTNRSGRLGREQFEWLEEQLDTELPVLMFSHIAPMNHDLEEFEDRNLEDLIRDNGNVVAFFSGHLHTPLTGAVVSGYGVTGYAVGATRMNPEARFLVEADPAARRIRIANARDFIWGMP